MGERFVFSTVKELDSGLQKADVPGIVFSGGEPFHPLNREDVGILLIYIRNKYPDKKIWVHTGYTQEEIEDDYEILRLTKDIDELESKG